MRFGVIGTSKITEKFIDAGNNTPGFELEAVYSRDAARGEAFAREWGARAAFSDLDQFLDDSAIDAVYIASPNAFHFEQTIGALGRGKHVLCEKPMMASADECKAAFQKAKDKKLSLMEAMRSLFVPGASFIKSRLGDIGELRSAYLDQSHYSSRYDNFKIGVIENAFDPSLKNSALYDMGIYPLEIALYFFGKPASVTASSVYLGNGMEALGSVILSYPNMVATVHYSKINDSNIVSEIQGEFATIGFEPLSEMRRVTITHKGESAESHEIDTFTNDMIYELKYFMRCAAGEVSVCEYNGITELAAEINEQILRLRKTTFDL
jgi:predicted dehydrogenase